MPSHNRSLTTHVGSLPRQEELMQIMFAREDGIPLDQVALEQKITAAVEDVVARQLKAGVDVINDGEMSKPSYATYVKDRLNGFGGTGNTFVYGDLVDFPKLADRMLPTGDARLTWFVTLNASPNTSMRLVPKRKFFESRTSSA